MIYFQEVLATQSGTLCRSGETQEKSLQSQGGMCILIYKVFPLKNKVTQPPVNVRFIKTV